MLFASFSFLLSGCGGGGGGEEAAVSILLQPNAVTLHPEENLLFTATVTGTADLGVTWQLQEGAAAGSLDSNGLYKAPATAGTYHVLAVSQADVRKSASAVVTVIPFAGVLDPAFGNGGKVTTQVGKGSDVINALAVQDGKVIAVGHTFNGTNSDFLILRYNTDGSLDPTFGSSGKVVIDFGSRDSASAVAVDSKNRLVVAGSAFKDTNYDFALVRLDRDGRVDTTFASGGKATTAIGSGDDLATDVAVRSGDDILIAGSAYNGSDFDFALVHYSSSGVFDSLFGPSGSGGKVLTSFSSGDAFVHALLLQPDGKIILAGDTFNVNNYDFALARYDSNGILDTAFNNGGRVVTPLPDDQILQAAAIRNNKIVAAGFSLNNTTGSDLVLARYDLSGQMDLSFDTDGVVTTSVGSGNDVAFTLLVQPDDKIFVAGKTFNGVNYDFVVAHYNVNGTLDLPFGGGTGKTITDFGGGDDAAYDMVIVNGAIIVAGESVLNDNRDLALARYDANGTLDPSFGTGGKEIADFEGASALIRSLTLQSDGKIIAGGDSFDGQAYRFTLARYTVAGEIDPAFGKDGKVTTPLDGGAGGKVLLRADGKILVAGTVRKEEDFDFGVALYDTDGTRRGFASVGFGPNGGRNNDILEAAAFQPDGKILATGATRSNGRYAFALARLNTDGTPDSSFGIPDPAGVSGTVITPAGTGDAFAYAIALQADRKIVLAGSSVVGSKINLALARYNTNGTLDPTFGGGWVLTPIGKSGNGVATAVRIQTDGKIVVGGYTINSGDFDFALARYNPDGTLDPTFGTGGKVTVAVDVGSDAVNDLVLQPDGKIVAVGFSYTATPDVAVVRFQSDGSLDPIFGQGGKRIFQISPTADSALAVALQPDGKILAAGGAQSGTRYDFTLLRLLP